MAERVYIVDDEAMIRRFVKKALDHEGMVTKTFEDGRQFLDALATLQPGVVLLDIRMPKADGLQVLDAMGPMTRVHGVLMLSSHGDVSTAVRAIKAGAADFIEKPFSVSPLIERVRQLHEQVMSWSEVRQVGAHAGSRLAVLSQREKEVGRAMAEGLSNKAIARALDLSPRTVEAHRARLMKKLEVTSSAEVVRLFSSTDI